MITSFDLTGFDLDVWNELIQWFDSEYIKIWIKKVEFVNSFEEKDRKKVEKSLLYLKSIYLICTREGINSPLIELNTRKHSAIMNNTHQKKLKDFQEKFSAHQTKQAEETKEFYETFVFENLGDLKVGSLVEDVNGKGMVVGIKAHKSNNDHLPTFKVRIISVTAQTKELSATNRGREILERNIMSVTNKHEFLGEIESRSEYMRKELEEAGYRTYYHFNGEAVQADEAAQAGK